MQSGRFVKIKFIWKILIDHTNQGDALYEAACRALARSTKLAALALLGPKKGCALARDFGNFCARAHFRVRKSQNLPKSFNDIKIKMSNYCKRMI